MSTPSWRASARGGRRGHGQTDHRFVFCGKGHDRSVVLFGERRSGNRRFRAGGGGLLLGDHHGLCDRRLEPQDDLADLDLIALRNQQLGDLAVGGRGNLEARLLGLDLDHRLVAFDGIAHRDKHGGHFNRVDVLPELGQFQLLHGRSHGS